MLLKQYGFPYSTCGPLTKNKVKETGGSRYIFKIN